MIKTIEINRVYRGTNIREENDGQIMELVTSIKKNGLLNPITVRKKGDKYRVIAGHRRFLAMQLLGEPFIECNVLEYEPTEKDILCIQLQENCCRKNMSAWEYVDLFDKLKAQGMTTYDIAEMCGRSQSWVSNQYMAARTLEANNAVNAETKTMTAEKIRKTFKGYKTVTNAGKKKKPVSYCFNAGTNLYTVTINIKEARKEFERFMKEFMEKWQN